MSQLAERYATALFEVTKAKGNGKECLETLVALRESLLENKDILELLGTPLISDSDKEAVIKSAVGSAMNDELTTFFQLITKNNRLAELPKIITAYQEKTSEEMGLVSGTVRSATELSDQEKAEVKKCIETELKVSVELQFQVDPKMIGGIEAKVGSYIFEDSIKSHMQKLNDFITRRVQ